VSAGRVPVRKDLEDVEPYGAPQLDVPVRLNTNETAEPPPAAFEAALAERLTGLGMNRYPDREMLDLRRRLGGVEQLPAERVWVANGSNEILQQLLLAYGGPDRRLLLFRPGYSMYPLLAQVTLTPVAEHDLPDDFVLTDEAARAAVEEHEPSIVFVAHPNNPTGIAAPHSAIRTLHDACDALVVVDEAYVEFGGESVRPLLDSLPRLVVTRTFSKAYRLAGLRLGYLLGPEWLVNDVGKVRLPYHLDTLKQAAAIAALDIGAAMLDHIPLVVAERERVLATLAAMPGVEAYPSSANFVLFRTTMSGLFDRLLERGILVRDFSALPRLDGCLRVTIGTVDENDAFLEALGALTA
jgi:histidinol-phosphate aminotransferase